MPTWQLSPQRPAASMIFTASASSPPKYLAGPRAAMAHTPGCSASTRGQNSSTTVTTRSSACASGPAPGVDADRSWQRTTSTRPGALLPVAPLPVAPLPVAPLPVAPLPVAPLPVAPLPVAPLPSVIQH
jgi:hypothetical protein